MEPLALAFTIYVLIQLIRPDVRIPIHYDDYDVFASPEDFRQIIEVVGLLEKVVFLDRDQYCFRVDGIGKPNSKSLKFYLLRTLYACLCLSLALDALVWG